MTQLVLVKEDGNNLIVSQGSQHLNTLFISQQNTSSVVQTGIPGPRGIQGIAGESNIGGYLFELNNLKNDDTLSFYNSKWINREKEYLTDGGNF